MTTVDHFLLSRFYEIAKISTIQLEVFLNKIKKPELQTIIAKQISNYEVLVKECCTLAKSHSINLPDHVFFKRCKQVIEENFEAIKSISLDLIIASTTMLSLNTLSHIYNVESADSETISLGKHLQNMQDNHLQILKQIK